MFRVLHSYPAGCLLFSIMRRCRRRPKLLPISMCHSKLFGIVLAWFHCPRLSPPCADTPCRRRLGRRPTTTSAIAAGYARVYLLRVHLVIDGQERSQRGPCELHSYVHRRTRLINRRFRATTHGKNAWVDRAVARDTYCVIGDRTTRLLFFLFAGNYMLQLVARTVFKLISLQSTTNNKGMIDEMKKSKERCVIKF